MQSSAYDRNAEGEVRIGGADLTDLVTEYGSPLYVYNFDHLRHVYRHLRDLLHPKIDLYYAVKANPNPTLIKQYVDLGAGFDLSSAGELILVRDQGANLHRTSFAGPGKTERELLEAIKSGVGMLSVESFSELTNVAQIAQSMDNMTSVTIRVNPSRRTHGFYVKMGGIPSQFGIDQERLPEVIALVESSKWLVIEGLHVYSGTQSLDEEAIVENITNVLQIGEISFENSGISLKKINLGGGFGVAYYDGEVDLEPKRLINAINQVVATYLEKHPQTYFVLELGRYLVAATGIYVTRVIRTKKSRGSSFLVLDGGMNHYLAASGNLGQIFRQNFPVIHGTKPGHDGKVEKYHIVGPLCTILDRIATNVQLPLTDEGDLLAFPLAGAYAYTASPLQFLSHPAPAEVAVIGGEILKIRQKVESW